MWHWDRRLGSTGLGASVNTGDHGRGIERAVTRRVGIGPITQSFAEKIHR
jgi:hypothetical protein